MELPVLMAIISVTGTLLGTIVGGSIVTGGNYVLARRRERLEFRTACRLLATELHAAQFTVKFALGNHRWWRPHEELKTEAWEKYKHLLAPYLSYEAWEDVWLAAGNLYDANALAAAPRPQSDATDILLPETENALTILLTSFERDVSHLCHTFSKLDIVDNLLLNPRLCHTKNQIYNPINSVIKFLSPKAKDLLQ
jgi:hypothetical protein